MTMVREREKIKLKFYSSFGSVRPSDTYPTLLFLLLLRWTSRTNRIQGAHWLRAVMPLHLTAVSCVLGSRSRLSISVTAADTAAATICRLAIRIVRLDAHALHMCRCETSLNRLLTKKFYCLSHIQNFTILLLCKNPEGDGDWGQREYN